jgi:hypothetical protein
MYNNIIITIHQYPIITIITITTIVMLIIIETKEMPTNKISKTIISINIELNLILNKI